MPLSEKQMKYLALAWQCFDTEPKASDIPIKLPIDYEKFAQVAGLKSSASARELMRVTKNKLKEEYGALSGQVQTTNSNNNHTTPAKKKSTPGKRKKATTPPQGSGDEDGGDDEERKTPASKRVKKTATKAPPVVKSEPTQDDSDEDGLSLL
ncbi:hypothetical protein AC579_5136 [Pseudocercospora musae]|uniref:Uncharacterized protein n=1 Tax=Pseudocercospora musae TaxID=113226 RepID=A0A139INS6_9PEZI|nr:hypothetical protein AC579_5136 [Pseudocercospora musae]